MAKYTESLRIQVTPAQKKKIDRLADHDNRNTSDYVRNILFPPKK